MIEDIRTVKLNILDLTKKKDRILTELLNRCIEASNHLLETIDYLDVFDERETRFSLQKVEYKHLKNGFGLHSQIVVDLCKDAFAIHKKNKNGFSKYTIPYSISRSGDLTKTKNGNPIMRVATLNGRISLPISQDGAWNRFNKFINDGYNFTAFRLKRGKEWKIHIYLKKQFRISRRFNTILGIDVGSRTLASITILGREGIKKQLYFGRDIWNKQRDMCIRRGRLRSFKDMGSQRARRKLRKFKNQESNFVKTRCYQIANEIVKLAKIHNSLVAIEDLTNLNRSRLKRKSNRRIKRMPYAIFRVALEGLCKRNKIKLVAVNPYHTSKSCPKCGNIGTRVSKGAIFKCSCGYRANVDRIASLNIALRAEQIMFNTKTDSVQIPERDASVNRHVWKNVGCDVMRLHRYHPPEFQTSAGS